MKEAERANFTKLSVHRKGWTRSSCRRAVNGVERKSAKPGENKQPSKGKGG